MVVGGGGDGPMVGECGSTGMVVGHGAVFLMELWVSVWVFTNLLVVVARWWA